jgi:signal transduction histidine kinase
MEAPVVLARLARLTRDMLGAEYCSTWLWSAKDACYQPLTGDGGSPDRWRSLRDVRLDAANPLVRALARDDVTSVNADDGDSRVAAVLRGRGIALAVAIALRSAHRIAGIQIVGYRTRTDALRPDEERIARGLAHLGSMALTSARLMEQLAEASRLKSEFVSTLSHELRTPLNIILGYTEMIADDGVPREVQRQALGSIRHASLELLEMVQATLDLGRFEQGMDDTHLAAFSVADLWSELRGEFAAIVGKRPIALRWLPVAVGELVSDRRKVKQIVKHLVGNALKFTPAGEVTVSLERAGPRCTLTVHDTGIGIPADQVPFIFDMFRQVDGSDSRSYGGVGLGLYLVRRLVAQLHGDVDVDSTVGVGSTFRVHLPVMPADAAERDSRTALG